MEEKELLKAIRAKAKDIKGLRGVGNKNPRFKTWHVSTLGLLKNLPKNFTKQANSFKSLAFTDTKYHRTSRPSESDDIQIFNRDLEEALKILKSIKPLKKPEQE